MSGRLTKAACGHPGRVVIGTYVECLRSRCDGLPGVTCPKCGSSRVHPFVCQGVPEGTMACEPHGHVWWPGMVSADDRASDDGG